MSFTLTDEEANTVHNATSRVLDEFGYILRDPSDRSYAEMTRIQTINDRIADHLGFEGHRSTP